ncbi:hypothetical protein, partial [Tsukamurella pulmonis]|uniref:hypothetical protein n=1 Tax=Tsukamurella pulmonis TaxID=47312 RepID=UPI001A9E81AC
ARARHSGCAGGSASGARSTTKPASTVRGARVRDPPAVEMIAPILIRRISGPFGSHALARAVQG